MTERSEWTGRVGTAWAEEWQRTDRSFNGLTARLLDYERDGMLRTALDIGCGAGEVAWYLAGRNPCAQIRGIDVSADLLAVARKRAAGFSNLVFEQADATRWTAPTRFSPELLISRHGVMFFADPVAAFANLRLQAAPKACLRFSCFRARSENVWYTKLVSVLPLAIEEPPPEAPGPFAFADPTRVTTILTAAGWGDVAFEPFDYPMVAGEAERGAVDEAVRYFQRIGPVARGIAELPEEKRATVRADLEAMLRTHYDRGRVTLPSAAWIVTARAP